MLTKIFTSAIIMAPCFSLCAQDATKEERESPPVEFSGAVDVYYRYNFSNPAPGFSSFNSYTSFTNSQNSFEVGMASIKVKHQRGKAGFVADLGFGKRAEAFAYNDANTRLALKQAYVTYTPLAQLTFTAGTWATHIGYESADAADNRNYSMSYLFSFGPFSHTGLKANFHLGKSGLMIGLANPADQKSADLSPKTFIAQYSFENEEAIKMFFNFQRGKLSDSVRIEQFDVVTVSALSDKFSLGFNGSLFLSKSRVNGKFGSFNSWLGAAFYLNYDATKNVGFTLRPEYFDDKSGISGAALHAQVFATTLSGQIKLGALTLVPELRIDKASAPVFLDHDGHAISQTTTGLVAAVYKF